jgi:quinol-cytochrome oxidoreductase complex cytochrome b subunit
VKARPTDKVHTWPHLLVGEFVASLAVTAFLLVFSAFVNAPLLTLANFNLTPNPSKAPWYFLGLQELLALFHPMVAASRSRDRHVRPHARPRTRTGTRRTGPRTASSPSPCSPSS